MESWEKSMGGTFGSEGRTAHLLKTEELTKVMDALDLAIANVDFVSPKFRIPYNGSQYAAIRQLVKDRKIYVIEFSGPAPRSGPSLGVPNPALYVPALNMMRVFPK